MARTAGAVLSAAQVGGLPSPNETEILSPDWQPNPEFLRHLPRLLELASVPGTALAVVNGGRVWQRGFGRATEEPVRPVSDETVFEAASLGAPVFAYVVLRLVDAGLIDLDRPLFDHFPLAELSTPRMKRVTPRHVLSHSTGLPNWRQQPGPLEPLSEPGEAFGYSGEGLFCLQRVVEALTQKPFARLMREQVLDPFEMNLSSYVWLPEFESRAASGYDSHKNRRDVFTAIGRKTQVIAEDRGKPLAEWLYEDAAYAVQLVNPLWPLVPLYMVPNAATSLLTTAGDYAKFLTRLVATPLAPGLDLSETTRSAMSTPQVRLNNALHWGLGWGIQQDQDGPVLWHWGANDSFRNFVIADPTNGRAIVVLTNGENGTRIYERVIVATTGHDHPVFLW